MNNKIYIYFACFHDTEVYPTIMDAIEQAQNPENLVFGIDFQYIQEQTMIDMKHWLKENPIVNARVNYLKYTDDNFWEYVGLAKGRKRAYAMREDEQYALLIDGHSKFGSNWDRKLIYKYELAKMRGIKKPIVHGYAGYYVLGPNRERVWHPKPYMRTIRYQYYQEYDPTDEDQQTAKFKWHKRLPTFVITKANPEGDELVPNVKFSGNFSFTEYDICEHLPDWVLFEDEEIPWSINLYDAGFSFVFPIFQDPVVAHLYMGTKEPYDVRLTRDNIEKYIPGNDLQGFLRKKDKNIDDFLDDPKNFEKIMNYQYFARVKILSGETQPNYIPDSFR